VISPSHCTVKIDGVALDAKDFSINMEYPVDEPLILGATTMGTSPQSSGVLAVSGEFTLLVTDLVEYAHFVDRADHDVSLECATAGDEAAVFNMNICKLTQATPHVSGRDRLEATISFVSYFDTTATGNIQTVITNDDEVIPAP